MDTLKELERKFTEEITDSINMLILDDIFNISWVEQINFELILN